MLASFSIQSIGYALRIKISSVGLEGEREGRGREREIRRVVCYIKLKMIAYLSLESVETIPILFTTVMPVQTRPNIVCLPKRREQNA